MTRAEEGSANDREWLPDAVLGRFVGGLLTIPAIAAVASYLAPVPFAAVAAVMAAPPGMNTWGAEANTPSNRRLPQNWNSSSTPRMKPKSPMRLTMNAFFPASAADGRSYQNPIKRYEQRPTPSQPTNMSRKLFASTSTSIANVNRLR